MGTVLQYDSKGNLVAELDKDSKLPKLGTIALDGSGNRVGRVSDIIGNVNKPYLVVKTSRAGNTGKSGEISALYMGESKKISKKSKREEK